MLQLKKTHVNRKKTQANEENINSTPHCAHNTVEQTNMPASSTFCYHMLYDRFWGNIVLLNRVKSVCGVGLWFESSRSPLYSNSLPSFPLPSLFLVSLWNWGQGWKALALFSGAVWHLQHHHHLPHTTLIFSFLNFRFCAGIHHKEWKGVWLVSAFHLTISILRVFSVLLSFKKAMGCLCTGKAAKNRCQEDYSKLAKHNIDRNKN